MNSLSDIRKKIDKLDSKIINLLKERLITILSTMDKKDRIEDISREEEILSRIKECSENEYIESYLKSVYSSMFIEGKRIQNKMRNLNKKAQNE